jgi:hypothetical protein
MEPGIIDTIIPTYGVAITSAATSTMQASDLSSLLRRAG